MPNQTGSPQDYWASIRKRERKNGTVAYTVLCHLDGRQFPVTFDNSEAHAEAFKAAVKAHGIHRALKMHDLEPPRREASAAPTTVAQWCRHYIDHLTAAEDEYTIDCYERYLRMDIGTRPLGSIPLTKLTEEDIAAWVNTMASTPRVKTGRPPAPKSIANWHGFLSAALGAAVPKLIPANPAAGRKLPKRTAGARADVDIDGHQRRSLTEEEWEALYAAFSEAYKPMVQFMIFSGFRWGEVSSLKPGDVDRKTGEVRVRRAWKWSQKSGYHLGPPKTDTSRREVIIDKDILDTLDYSHEYLFTNARGTAVRYHKFRDIWDRAVAKAKPEDNPTPHCLRHTCGSWLLNSGEPMLAVSRLLGHKNIATTSDIYGHVDKKTRQALSNKMAKLLTPVTT